MIAIDGKTLELKGCYYGGSSDKCQSCYWGPLDRGKNCYGRIEYRELLKKIEEVRNCDNPTKM